MNVKLCGQCRRPHRTRWRMCEKCRSRTRNSARERGKQRHKNGLCIVCGGRNDSHPWMLKLSCVLCRKKMRERLRTLRAERVEKKLCIWCGDPAQEPMQKCARCMRKARDQWDFWSVKKKALKSDRIDVLEKDLFG